MSKQKANARAMRTHRINGIILRAGYNPDNNAVSLSMEHLKEMLVDAWELGADSEVMQTRFKLEAT